MKVSIIVPCRNEKNYVTNFIKSLTRQLGFTEFQVIIADGNSDDGTQILLNRIVTQYENISFVNNEKKIVSSGLNLALKLCDGDVVVRMDMHTTYHVDYVEKCVDALLTSNRSVWCVGGAWRPKSNGSFLGRAIASAFTNRFMSGNARSRDVEYSGVVDTVYLGCWRREDLTVVGGFDESLVRNQDDELCLRIRRGYGKTICQSRHIKSSYEPRSSLKKLFMQYYQYGFWKGEIVKKHGQFGAFRHWLFIATPFLSLFLSLLFPVLFIWISAIYIACMFSGAAFASSNESWMVKIISVIAGSIMHVSYFIGLCVSIFRLQRLIKRQYELSR